MSARPDLTGTGIPESRWQASGVLDALPRVGLDTLVGDARVLVVAPHPDDEVLGAGGLLAALTACHRRVSVLGVTDGEGSHPGSPTLDPETMASRRRAERRAALRRLGLPPAELLGLPDGAVGASALALAIAARIGPGDVVLAPRRGDGHPDHDAAADAAAEAVTARGARLLGYGVWIWHHLPPGELRDAVRFDLDPTHRDTKTAAIAEFTTQLHALSDDPRDRPVLPPGVLARLDRPFEVFW